MSKPYPKVPLLKRTIYKQYCLRYRYNFLRFLVEVSGKKPTWQQVLLAIAMSVPNFAVSCVSGHSTGKSYIFAWFMIWQVTVFPFSNLILTGPKFEQLKRVIWKELADGLDQLYAKIPWLEGYFRKDAKSFYAIGYKENWFAIPQTAPKKEPEKLAGQHREKLTFLIDEGSGLPDEHYEVINGALTGRDNSLAIISQGTRPNGYFYDTHHTLKNLFKTFSFDSELSPLVSKEWIKRRLIEYGGFFATEYQIRVKGAFPNQIEGRLISRAWAEICGDVVIKHDEAPGILITVDVSGYGHDKTVYLVTKVSGYGSDRKIETVELIIKTGVSKIPNMVGDVKAIYKRYEHLGAVIGVDYIGVGQGVYDYLALAGLPVEKINVGAGAYEDDRFLNQRAEWSWWLRDIVFKANISFRGVSRQTRQLIFDEFGNIPYRIQENGKMKLWSKEQMRNEGIKSPDIYDTYMFSAGMDYVAMKTSDDDRSHFSTARAKANAAMEKFKEQVREAGL